MADEPSTWKRLFDQFEKALAPRLEEFVQSEEFSDASAVMARARSEFQARTERAMNQNLHFWNMPSSSDIQQLSDQIASLERRVRDMSKRLDELVESLHGDGDSKSRAQPQRARESNPA